MVCFIQFVPIWCLFSCSFSSVSISVLIDCFDSMFVAHFDCSQWIESEWVPSMAVNASGYITSLDQINGRASIQTTS